jgi:FLVCR family feline leukemia virus subgroup C receptor-related protein
MALVCFFDGACMIPVMAVGMDFGVELTYPVGESFSAGVLMSAGQIFGIVTTVVCSILIDKH